MLTLQQIKADPEYVISRLAVKGFDGRGIITEILEIDEERRKLQHKCDTDGAELKKLASSIGSLMKQGDKEGAEKAKAEVARLKGEDKGLQERLAECEEEQLKLLLTVPNLPNETVPLGMTAAETASGLEKIRAVKGRMNILRGVNESVIIDDSYNSSPLAVASALRALYQLNVPQRIVVLGSMNELGDMSQAEHAAVGKLCDPIALSHVVTVGEDAAKYLAPVAQTNGCHVASFKNALEAGAYVHKYLERGGAVLFKGSQGGVYLEEAIKIVLHSTEEESQLVRQSDAWLKKKRAYFSDIT